MFFFLFFFFVYCSLLGFFFCTENRVLRSLLLNLAESLLHSTRQRKATWSAVTAAFLRLSRVCKLSLHRVLGNSSMNRHTDHCLILIYSFNTNMQVFSFAFICLREPDTHRFSTDGWNYSHFRLSWGKYLVLWLRRASDHDGVSKF